MKQRFDQHGEAMELQGHDEQSGAVERKRIDSNGCGRARKGPDMRSEGSAQHRSARRR